MATVYLQIGHYPRKTGITGTAGEQEFAKATAARCARMLRKRGHKVFIRGADDGVFATDVFVAFHADGSVSTSAQGASVGHQDGDGERIASQWKRYYQRLGWGTGFRGDNYTAALGGYYGVARARAAGSRYCFIIEAGFMTNPAEGAELRSRKGQARVAKAVVQAVGKVVGHPTPIKDSDARPERDSEREPERDRRPKRKDEDEGVVHVVQAGETLWAIATKYGTTVDAVKQLNGLSDDVIRPGDRLKVQ